jgi:hypothetical protein
VHNSWILFKWFLHIYKTDLAPGECLFLVSMEMPLELIWRRLAAIELKLPYKEFRAGILAPADEARLVQWVEAMKTPNPNRPILYVAGPNTIREVADIAAKSAELRPRAVGIDGFYILGRSAKANMWERTLQNVTEIKLDLCAPLNVPVVATTQLKGSKNRDDLEADADDAAYAKAIGDYADAMRGLFMDDALEQNSQRLFRGMESREFQPVDLKINFDLAGMDFSEIEVIPKGGGPAGAAAVPPVPFNGPAPPSAIIAGTPPAPGSKSEIDF